MEKPEISGDNQDQEKITDSDGCTPNAVGIPIPYADSSKTFENHLTTTTTITTQPQTKETPIEQSQENLTTELCETIESKAYGGKSSERNGCSDFCICCAQCDPSNLMECLALICCCGALAENC